MYSVVNLNKGLKQMFELEIKSFSTPVFRIWLQRNRDLPWAGEPTEARNYLPVIVGTEDGNCDMQMYLRLIDAGDLNRTNYWQELKWKKLVYVFKINLHFIAMCALQMYLKSVKFYVYKNNF